MTIESKVTTEKELLDRGFKYVGKYKTPKEEYQIYESLNERLFIQPGSEGNLWIIEVHY